MDEMIVAQPKKQRRFPVFYIILALYSCIILVLMAFGLRAFEDYLLSYELSLPHSTTDVYLQKLTPDYIAQRCDTTLEQIDSAIQTKEEAIARMEEALSEPVIFFKRIKECTDTKLVYTLRCGTNTIGSFEMEQERLDSGSSHWVVTKETFDLSFLLQDGYSVTVPHDAVVTVNGNVLSSESVIESGIQYEVLKDFYEDYQLPSMTTYQIGRYIGEVSMTVTDPAGNPIDPEADHATALDNCSDEEKTALDLITKEFITDYIHFTSQTNKDTDGNLSRLREHMVSGSSLDKRMRNAVSGLKWVTDRNVTIRTIAVNQYTSIGNGLYICNITYLVDTRDITGKIQEESNVSVVYQQAGSTLKAEAMITN